jgi:excisionase family DNA binding protein
MEFLTLREVAERVRVSEYTAREWLKKGLLKGVKPGGASGRWRIRQDALDEFLNKSA